MMKRKLGLVAALVGLAQTLSPTSVFAQEQTAQNLADLLLFPQLPSQVVDAARNQFFDSNGNKTGPLSNVSFSLVLLSEEFKNFNNTIGKAGGSFEPATEGVSVVGDRVVIQAIAKDGDGNALLTDLVALGLSKGASMGGGVSGLLPISAVEAAAKLDNVTTIYSTPAQVNAGLVTSQADTALQANLARANAAVDGTGLTVGVLSDSLDCLGGLATDIANGDLPAGGVETPPAYSGFANGPCPFGGSDEGRAMAQIVHDIAPGAQIKFGTAFGSQVGFAANIIGLAQAGARVIVDDVTYFREPMFSRGFIDYVIDSFMPDVLGITDVHYFSSAGNSARQSYEATFAPSSNSTLTPATPFGGIPHNFAAPLGDLPLLPVFIPQGASILLSFQWDQYFRTDCSVVTPAPAGGCAGAQTDLDIYLFDRNMNLVAGAVDANIATGDPVEILAYTNNASGLPLTNVFYIAVLNFAGPMPNRIKWVDFSGNLYVQPGLDTQSSTVMGHPNGERAIAVGAVDYTQTPVFGMSTPVLESFSSAGGISIFGDSVRRGDTTTFAATPTTVGQRQKPEISAPDGADTTFFGSSDPDSTGFPNFFGTSASAPAAAAVAALLLQKDPTLTIDEMRQLMMASTLDINVRAPSLPLTPGYDFDSGAGLLDASAAFVTLTQGRPFPPVPTPGPQATPIPPGPTTALLASLAALGEAGQLASNAVNGDGGAVPNTSGSSAAAMPLAMLFGMLGLAALRLRRRRH